MRTRLGEKTNMMKSLQSRAARPKNSPMTTSERDPGQLGRERMHDYCIGRPGASLLPNKDSKGAVELARRYSPRARSKATRSEQVWEDRHQRYWQSSSRHNRKDPRTSRHGGYRAVPGKSFQRT